MFVGALGLAMGVLAISFVRYQLGAAPAEEPDRPQLLRWAVWAWVIGGAVFLLFGAMNFYTHIGMYYNIAHGTNYTW